MRDTLLKQFCDNALPESVSGLLEHAHSVARGTAAAISLARIATVERTHGNAETLASAESDHLLALASSAAALLGDRLESLSLHLHDKAERLSGVGA
ncbi:hypothetical protein F4827_000345 [Paraburkholderia bannensis]|uniref:Uncharacterized protein n=1 Tax=Paraburkholderia bannensis TaxID=765414 RepID=A0A7W9WQS8_9BURK|nr:MULTISPECIES: hypothetical protein [Paraburkholderia]MBB3255447.1 hypothetical protein [Paraburkholderia sp. WP4_3_2]MBB6100541.1 hypothetical protein [Paraburkholderia bannensis]